MFYQRIKKLFKFQTQILASFVLFLNKKNFLSRFFLFFINLFYYLFLKTREQKQEEVPFLRLNGDSQNAFQNASFIADKTGPLDSKTWNSNFVLIVVETAAEALYRYRVASKERYLNLLNIPYKVFHFSDEASVFPYLHIASCLVFYRVPHCVQVEHMCQEARRLGIPIFYDIDDIIFSEHIFRASKTLQCFSPEEQKAHLLSSFLYLQALLLCDYGIASTQKILQEMQNLKMKNQFILENGITAELLALSRSCDDFKSSRYPHRNTLYIAYGSGSKTHDHDFQIVAEAILYILEKYPHVQLRIYGELTIPLILEKYVGSRIERMPFMRYEEYLKSLATVDINIAPLYIDDFNEAKSNLKFVEAALFEIPTIASPTEPFRAIVRQGWNGYCAETTQEWQQYLEALVVSDELRHTLGKRAKESCLEVYSDLQLSQKFLRALEEGAGKFFRPRQEGTLHIVDGVSWGRFLELISRDLTFFAPETDMVLVLSFSHTQPKKLNIERFVHNGMNGLILEAYVKDSHQFSFVQQYLSCLSLIFKNSVYHQLSFETSLSFALFYPNPLSHAANRFIIYSHDFFLDFGLEQLKIPSYVAECVYVNGVTLDKKHFYSWMFFILHLFSLEMVFVHDDKDKGDSSLFHDILVKKENISLLAENMNTSLQNSGENHQLIRVENSLPLNISQKPLRYRIVDFVWFYGVRALIPNKAYLKIKYFILRLLSHKK